MRLNKFLAERLGISRREADVLILNSRVRVNNKLAELGMQVTDGQLIFVDGRQITNTNTHI